MKGLDEGRAEGPNSNQRRFRRSSGTLVFAFALCISGALSQSPESTTIQGKVSDPAGAPIANAVVRLEHAGTPAAETRTNTDGRFIFTGVASGDFTLTAETGGRRSPPASIHPGASPNEPVDLTIGAADPKVSPAAGMEFADNPNFTIAAVTDWTAAGGHGSDAVLRTSEALNRETVNLKTGESRATESANDWKHAESDRRAAVASAPQDFQPNHNLGVFYFQAGMFSQAIPPLEAAYRIAPGDYENQYELALALIANGQVSEARGHVEKLVALQNNSEAHRLAGELYEKLGDPLAAVHEFERAVQADPSERNYFAWGSELLLHRAIWQARDVFSAGVKAWPKSERMLTALGAALFAGALYDEAAERLCEASDLNPADPEPYTFMGKIEISAPNALPCIEQKLARYAAQQPTDPLANYFYAMALWKQGGPSPDPPTFARVQDLLRNSLKVDPQCGEAWLQLGVLESTRHDYPKAIEFYTKAIDANPQFSEAHYRLGIAYDRVGEKDKAAEQLRLHEELEKQQAAAVEKQRREVKQFLVVVDGRKSDSNPEPRR
jgi:tetratricopeptide (TPR) repeat protein